MARKVFISFLGAGLYSDIIYQSQGFESSKTKFVQQASLEYFGAKEWSPDDAAFVMVTEKARKENWEVESGSRQNSFTGKDLPHEGLEKVLGKMGLPFDVIPVDIPDGKDESEIWTIFDRVFNLLQDEDQLYADLTHGFRYLPMFMLVMGNYARFLKKVKISGLSYGNMEARTNDKAPMVNLLPLSALQQWTFATADFLENGYTDRLAQLAKDELTIIRRERADMRVDAGTLGAFVKCLDSLVAERLLCRGLDVVNAIRANKAQENFDKIEHSIIPPLGPVLKKSLTITKGATTPGVSNLFVAAEWCFQHNLFQQSATFMEEGVISFFCERHAISLDERDKRELITSALAIRIQDIPRDEQIVKPEYRDLLDRILEDEMMGDAKFLNTVSNLIDLRNDYNHCGMRLSYRPAESIKKALTKIYPQLVEKLFNKDTHKEQTARKKIFINFSNHPSSFWEKTQLDAAKKYGEILDMSFPSISPDADLSTIEEHAEDCIETIINYAKEACVTLHVMGEMTFTFSLVTKALAKGITCVASTSERVVEEHDGIKTSEFRFVRFREY